MAHSSLDRAGMAHHAGRMGGTRAGQTMGSEGKAQARAFIGFRRKSCMAGEQGKECPVEKLTGLWAWGRFLAV